MKKKLKFIIPAVLVILIGVAAALYFLTDLFKSPKQLFYKYLAKTFETKSEYSYDDFLNNLKFYNEKACTTKAEITLDSNSEEFAELKNVKVNFVAKSVPNKSQAYSSTELLYNNEKLSSLEYLQNNNNYGVKCEDIYKDYFYFENKNLKTLANKFGLDSDSIPDSIQDINIYDLYYISANTRESISKKYSKVIDSKLDKDSFSAEKDVKVSVNGTEVKTNSYTLTLDANDVYTILISTLETLKDDDETLDLFMSKYNMLYSNYETEEFSKDEIKSALEETIDSLKDAKSSASGATGKIRLTVYESKGKTVKLTIKSGTEKISLDLTSNKNDGKLGLYVESYNENVFSLVNNYTTTGDTTTGTIILAANGTDSAKLEYSLINSNSEFKLEGTVTSLVEESEESSFTFMIDITGDNLKKQPTKLSCKSHFKITSGSDYITLNLNGSVEYTDSVEIPDLSSSNGVCLNTVTDEELETIKTDINTNINSFIDKTLTKFNMTRTELELPETINIFEEIDSSIDNLEDIKLTSNDLL